MIICTLLSLHMHKTQSLLSLKNKHCIIYCGIHSCNFIYCTEKVPWKKINYHIRRMYVCTKAKITSNLFRNTRLLGPEHAYFESRTGLTYHNEKNEGFLLFVCLAWTNIQKYKHVKSQALISHFTSSYQYIWTNSSSEQSTEAYNVVSKNVSGSDYRCALKVNQCHLLYILGLCPQRLTL